MRCISPILVRQGGRRDFVPCGKCNFCLETKRADWTFRLLQEKKDAITSIFLTLTYDEHHVPYSGTFARGDARVTSLCKRDLQLFTKRLRKLNAAVSPSQLRYYSVGEYGTRFDRAHYHSIMFNLDRRIFPVVKEVWGKGNVKIGTVNVASCHYVAKYVINRVGDYSGREPPFAFMSKRPGIGAKYLDTHREWHKADLRNYTQVHGQINRLPRYFKDKIFNPHERALLAANAIDHSTEAYLREVERLTPFHEDAFYYYEERDRAAHELITSKINEKDKF